MTQNIQQKDTKEIRDILEYREIGMGLLISIEREKERERETSLTLVQIVNM